MSQQHSQRDESRESSQSNPDLEKPSLLNPSPSPSQPLIPSKSRWTSHQGWRQGVLTSALAALLILIFNTVLLIWSSHTYGTTSGIGIGYTGSCAIATKWVLIFKITINIFGTILLSISSYTMQCLSSPTRKDLDRAHAAGEWMDIAVPSVRNLSRIGWKRVVLWGLLAGSSVPIHLLYNSTVFKTLDAEIYTVVAVTPEFLRVEGFNEYYWWEDPMDEGAVRRGMNASQVAGVAALQGRFFANETVFANLTNGQCIDAYAQATVSGNADLMLVLEENPGLGDDSVVYWNRVNSFGEFSLPYSWVCHDDASTPTPQGPSDCNTLEAMRNASMWTIDGQRIAYCLSQEVPPKCRLQFSIYLMGAVIACNAVKIICMLATFWQHSDPLIVTLGDAVADFLKVPDENTVHRCLMGRDDIRREPALWLPNAPGLPPPKTANTARPRRWFIAASRRRWALTLFLVTSGLILVAVFLGVGAAGFRRSQGSDGSLWDVGFGEVDSRTLIPGFLPQNGVAGLNSSILIANLPQVVLSAIYLAYNGVFTSMLLEKEWDGFASTRKSLRVSTPEGEQRVTRWLTLPYRYSIPLLSGSSLLHLLVANSLFLVSINIYQNGNIVDGGDIAQLGWSPIPMLSVIVVGFFMLVILLAMGARRLKGNMPLVHSCSLVISAACHHPVNDDSAYLVGVQWGEVKSTGDKTDAAIGHCCFTSQVIMPVTCGRHYAGR